MTEILKKFTQKNKAELLAIQTAYREATSLGDFTRLSGNSDTVTLYHGTSSHLLPVILKDGLKPRELTGLDNWTNVESSLDSLVYLTNKWHYFFAMHTVTEHYEEAVGEHWADILKANPEKTPAFPCYIEVEVPVSMLTIDEDMMMSNYMQALYEQTDGNPLSAVTVEGTLAEYGTLAHIGTIPPSAIKSFTIIPDKLMLVDTVRGDYANDYKIWQKGLGVGNSLTDLGAMEKRYKGTKKYDVASLPKNKEVVGIKVMGGNANVSLKLAKK